MSSPDSSLLRKLIAALKSREERSMKRVLPNPLHAPTNASTSTLIDFNSNDYLSLSRSAQLKDIYLSKLQSAPSILGSGGSRLLVNGEAHHTFEARLRDFFYPRGQGEALLFNSGYDANVSIFSCVPQPGDHVVYDEYIHASVHDGLRMSRIPKDSQHSFTHNSLQAFRTILRGLSSLETIRTGRSSVFIGVESLYSMDGTFAPLVELITIAEQYLPRGNAYFIVDEAHSTGIYGLQGRGRVAMLGLEDRVFLRLHTFGKALAATGAVVLMDKVVRDYLLNYARPLIYTTSLSYANIILADCSFDMLTNGTAEAASEHLQSLSKYLVDQISLILKTTPHSILNLPSHLQQGVDLSSKSEKDTLDYSPIIPLLTPHPISLSSHLLSKGMNAKPIRYPTVPKGKERVRVCLHGDNTFSEVEALVGAVREWVGTMLEQGRRSIIGGTESISIRREQKDEGVYQGKVILMKGRL